MSDGNKGDKIRRRVKKAQEVFDKYEREIRAMIEFNVKDEFIAEDIFQDLFVAFVKNPIPSAVENVRAYIYRTIANDAIDRFRKIRNHREGAKKYAEYHNDSAVEMEPQNMAILADEVERMFQLIESCLPPREACAIFQRYGIERSDSDKTSKLNVDKRSSSRYVSEAIRKMRILVLKDERMAG